MNTPHSVSANDTPRSSTGHSSINVSRYQSQCDFMFVGNI